MKKEVKILLIDENEATRVETKDVLLSRGYFNIIESNNCEDAFLKITKFNPHIIISDMWLSKFDGIELVKMTLKRAYEFKIIPKFIMLSYIISNTLFEEALKSGACACLDKNCDKQELCKYIEALSENKLEEKSKFFYSNINVEEKVTNTLHQFGIPANIIGFQYLRSAIKLAIEDISSVNAITKIIYPTVAKIYNTASNKVERGIRHAIEVAWNKGRLGSHVLNTYNLPISSKPTNSEFIATIADDILLECKYSNERSTVKIYK